MGAIIIPNISPNLIQDLFNGDRSFEFSNPKIKNHLIYYLIIISFRFGPVDMCFIGIDKISSMYSIYSWAF